MKSKAALVALEATLIESAKKRVIPMEVAAYLAYEFACPECENFVDCKTAQGFKNLHDGTAKVLTELLGAKNETPEA